VCSREVIHRLFHKTVENEKLTKIVWLAHLVIYNLLSEDLSRLMANKARKEQAAIPASTRPAEDTAGNPLLSNAKLRQIYSTMLRGRLLEEQTGQSRKKGKSRSKANTGTEATIVAAAIDLRRTDWISPLRHDLIGTFVKGATLTSILAPTKHAALHGTDAKNKSTGKPSASPEFNAQGEQSQLHILPNTPNPAAQLNLAAGVALAMKAKNDGSIVMAFCGDTSTSGQRWLDALTLAGEHFLPLLVITYTKFSSRVSRRKSYDPTVSQITEGRHCGLPVIPVDADDAVAMYRVAFESIHKARHGGGPTLIEATYFPAAKKGHAHDSRGQNSDDAISRMEAYLASKGLFSESWKQSVIDDFKREMNSVTNPSGPRLAKRRRA
jgi:TPP-dependent pyruvate/acetoin dehydrogenase alpha subunit